MLTEELVQSEQEPCDRGLFHALVERVPSRWWIADDRGRPVTLSLAGHVLHFGRAYKLCVGPFVEGGPVPEVRLLSRPTWLVPVDLSHTAEKHGQPLASIAFRVRRQTSWLAFVYWLREIYSDTIEVEATAPGNEHADRRQVSCPVVARSRWLFRVVALAVLGATAFAVLELIAKQGWSVVSSLVSSGATPDPWQISWGWLVLFALLSPGVAFALNLEHLLSRSGELKREFRRRWPTVGGSRDQAVGSGK